jgi:hypothetical protein
MGSVGGHHLEPSGRQRRVQGLTVVGVIPAPPRRAVGGQRWRESLWDKGDVMWRRSRRVDGERQTSAACHGHARRPLAPRGRSHLRAPVFATTQVASMTPALRSSAPRARTSSARHASLLRRGPSRPHGWKRRRQVG